MGKGVINNMIDKIYYRYTYSRAGRWGVEGVGDSATLPSSLRAPLEKLREYEDLMLMPDEVKKLADRDTAMPVASRPIIHGYSDKGMPITTYVKGFCPICGTHITEVIGKPGKFCPYCGQRMKWE